MSIANPSGSGTSDTTKWGRFGLVMCFALPVLTNCGSDASPQQPDAKTIDASKIDSAIDAPPLPARKLGLGFSPFGASAAKPFGDWTFAWLPEADFVHIHTDDFLGVPWQLFESGNNPTLPATWVASWDELMMPAQQSTKPVLVSLSPISDRSRLAPRVNADGSISRNWDPTVAGVNNAACYTFNEAGTAAHATAYVNYLTWLIDRYALKRLFIGTETDIFWYKCPANKDAYKNFMSLVKAVLKRDRPTTQVMMTFSLDYFDANGLGGAINGCGAMSLDACRDARIDEALALSPDGIGLSYYPQSYFPMSATFPTDRIGHVRARTTATSEIWITESGWSAVPVRLSYAPTCGEPFYTDAVASEATQTAALQSLLADAEAANVRGLTWWSSRDYLDAATAATCPCTGDNESCSRAASFGAAEFFYRAYANFGLWRYDGTARPALATWQTFRQRPLRWD